MAETKLLQSLQSVQRRMMTIGLGTGAGWAVGAVVALVMVFAWADMALDLAPHLRIACLLVCLGAGLVLILRGGWISLRGSRPRAVARRIDRIANTGGQVLSGVDLMQQYQGSVAASTLSGQLATLAIQRAADLASRVRSAAAVPANSLIWPASLLAVLAVILGALALSTPRLLSTQWARFVDPFGDHPPYSAIELKVEPGDTRVVYGSSLDVRVTPSGGVVDAAQLTFDSAGQGKESVPMFPEPGGTWRATVSQVTAGGTYFVRAGNARSHKFRFDVITVPELRDLRVRISPPPYTHLPPYSGPVPDRGISGLPGTKVEIWANSNRPLSGGVITLTPAPDASTTRPAATPAPAAMSPVAGASQVSGSFMIDSAGKLGISIIDTEGQACREPFTTSVTVLKDLRPFVRILEPKENSFATPDAKLEVNLAAEDDYGISSLQLFRSLNDTRASAANVPVPANQPTRLSASVPFDLSEYGLAPGDVVKFYARVEDNDPAGAKGSESPVVTLHIISNEEFNRMAVAREGLETLEARYAMAQRLMEGFDDKLKKLEDDLKKAPPDSPLAKEKQEQIKKLQAEMKDGADQVNEAAKDELPFDADKEFRKQLADIAKSMSEAAEETDAAAKEGLSSSKAGEKLAAVRKKLGGKRDEFKKEVTQPLDNLDKIFPLIEDQERFVEIWTRQQDLADRMKSLVGANADDPKVKGRMRDLEGEQRQLVTDLNDLLNDIRDHAIRLPVVGRPLVRATPGESEVLARNSESAESPNSGIAGSALTDAETAQDRVGSALADAGVAQNTVGWAYSPTANAQPARATQPRWASTPTLRDSTVAAHLPVAVGRPLVRATPPVDIRRALACGSAMDESIAGSALADAGVAQNTVGWAYSSTANAQPARATQPRRASTPTLREATEGAHLPVAARPAGHADSASAKADTALIFNDLFSGPACGALASELTGVLVVADDAKPDDGKQLKDTLEELQKSSFDFITKVRQSGAFEQMNESATDLGAFDGVHAAAKAQEAADTLKKFISECQGTEGKLRGLCVLVFRPNISHAMENTIGQLLDAEGMNPGGGTGASGGFSQRRSSLRNSSLYGRVPSRSNGGGKRGVRSAAGPGGSGNSTGGDRDSQGGTMDEQKLRASGESDVAVPPQYKRKVGEYFQRAADELGQE